MTSQPIKLLINGNQDVRRCSIREFSYANLLKAIQDITLTDSFIITYQDDENDHVTISTQMELEEALQCRRDKSKIPKFEVTYGRNKRPNASPAQPPQSSPSGDRNANVGQEKEEANHSDQPDRTQEYMDALLEVPSVKLLLSRFSNGDEERSKELLRNFLQLPHAKAMMPLFSPEEAVNLLKSFNLQDVSNMCAGVRNGTAPSPMGNPFGFPLDMSAFCGAFGCNPYFSHTDEEEEPSNEKPTPAAELVEHVTLADGESVLMGVPLIKMWKVKNSGQTPWPKGIKVVQTKGDFQGTPIEQTTPEVQPGDEYLVAVDFDTPASIGAFSSSFTLSTKEGVQFGPELSVSISTVDADYC